MSEVMPEFVTVRAIRWLITGLFVISMSTSAYVLYLGKQADEDTRVAVAQVSRNTYAVCEANDNTARHTNDILDSLIAAVQITQSLPPAEKMDRIKRYQAIKAPVQECK